MHLIPGLKVQFLSWLNKPILPRATCILLKFHLPACPATHRKNVRPTTPGQRQLIRSKDIIPNHPVFQDKVEETSQTYEIHASLGRLTSSASASTNSLGLPAEGAPARSCPPPRPAAQGRRPQCSRGRGASRSPPLPPPTPASQSDLGLCVKPGSRAALGTRRKTKGQGLSAGTAVSGKAAEGTLSRG